MDTKKSCPARGPRRCESALSAERVEHTVEPARSRDKIIELAARFEELDKRIRAIS